MRTLRSTSVRILIRHLFKFFCVELNAVVVSVAALKPMLQQYVSIHAEQFSC